MEIDRIGINGVLIRASTADEVVLLLNILSRAAASHSEVQQPARRMHDDISSVVRQHKESAAFKFRPDGAHRDF